MVAMEILIYLIHILIYHILFIREKDLYSKRNYLQTATWLRQSYSFTALMWINTLLFQVSCPFLYFHKMKLCIVQDFHPVVDKGLMSKLFIFVNYSFSPSPFFAEPNVHIPFCQNILSLLCQILLLMLFNGYQHCGSMEFSFSTHSNAPQEMWDKTWGHKIHVASPRGSLRAPAREEPVSEWQVA